MDFYTQNIRSLKKKYPEIDDFLNRVVPSSGSIQVVTTTPSGSPTFYYTNGTGNKILVHSLYNPLKEAYELAHAKDLSNVGMVIVFGLGFGYHLRQLLTHEFYHGPIYVIESSLEVFKAALMHCDLRGVLTDERVHLFIEPDIDKMKNIVDLDPLFRSKIVRTESIYLPAYRRIFAHYYSQVSEAVNMRLTMNSVSILVAGELAANWDRNSVANLKYALHATPFSRFKDAFVGKPALMVAAGPSLDKNIEHIKQIQSKAVIVCVGTALKALLRVGIKPDFVTALDSSDVTLPQFEGIADTAGMWLFADMATPPRIVEMFYPRVAFYTGMHNVLAYNFYPHAEAEAMLFPCAGSVSNIALHLCDFFGCGPIIFVGLDLAIAEDGHSHAQGTMHQDRLLMPEKDQPFFMTVKGNCQPLVKTPQNFYIYLRWTEHFIKTHPGRTYINATEGGAHIEGAVVMPLGRAIECYLQSSRVCAETVCKRAMARDTKHIRRHILSRVARARKDLRTLDKYFKQGAGLVDKMICVVEGKKTFRNAAQEKKFSSSIKKFFVKLGAAKGFQIFTHTVQYESDLMMFGINQHRVHEKGFGQAILRLPGIFEKLQTTSKSFQKEFKVIQACAKEGVAK